MSSANRDILTVSLPICIPFIPSSCLIALTSPFLKLARDPPGHNKYTYVTKEIPSAFAALWQLLRTKIRYNRGLGGDSLLGFEFRAMHLQDRHCTT
jgi:hypothetical protein